MDISSNPIAASIIQPLEASQTRQIEPKAEEITVTKAKRQASAAEWEPYTKLVGDSQMGVISASIDMRERYSGVQFDLLEKAPDLMGKDWDFSVDSTGELVIIEGHDKLSDMEKMKLKDILEDNGMDDAMNKLADHVIGWGVGMRGPEGFSEEGGLDRFDVNNENFKDIIFGRELMLNMEISTNVKLTKQQTLESAWKTGGIGGNDRQTHLRAVSGYNEGKQPAANLIESQIMMRAEARF